MPALSPLQFTRSTGDALVQVPSGVLGAIQYGESPVDHSRGDDVWHPMAVSALLNQGQSWDAWHTTGDLEQGQCGPLRWRANKDWLFGALDIAADGDAAQLGVEALAYQAYQSVFAALQAHGRPRLLRVWNYLPHITGDGGGMERYRQFNIGRQQAFLDAGEAAFEGAPAACALGLRRGGGLTLRFIAGHTPVRALENPRQVPAWRYPDQYGPRAPTFSRAALAEIGSNRLALLVSGTASIVGHASQHEGDIQGQVAETLRNLHAVFEAAHAQCDADFDLHHSEPVIYIRHASQADAIRAQLGAALGADSLFMRSAVYLEADICRPELDIEIETQACARGQLRAA